MYDAENAVTVDRDATEDDINIIIEEDEEVARQRARNIEQTRLAEIGQLPRSTRARNLTSRASDWHARKLN